MPTASAIGAQNDGQPEPLSYLVPEFEQGLAAAGAAEGAGALLVVERAGEGPLGAVVAQHVMLQRVELLLPLGVALLHGIVSAMVPPRRACAARPWRPRAWRGRACRRLARSSFSSRSTRSRASLRGSLQRAIAASGSSAAVRPGCAQRRRQKIGMQGDKLVLHRQRRLRRPLALARQLVRRDRQPRQRQPLAQPEIEAGRRLDAHAVGARRQHEIARRRQGFEGGRAARDARRCAHRLEGRCAFGQCGTLGLTDQVRRQVAQGGDRRPRAARSRPGHRSAAAGGAAPIARCASGSAARPPACGSAPRP